MSWFHDIVLGFAFFGFGVTVWYVWQHSKVIKEEIIYLKNRVEELERRLFFRSVTPTPPVNPPKVSP